MYEPSRDRGAGSPAWPLRAGAARALGRIGYAAQAALTALLNDPEEPVRHAAAQALTEIRNE